MLSLMDYSILNALGELSPLQFLHIAVRLKKNKLEESDPWLESIIQSIKASKNVYFTVTKNLYDPHVHGHIPQNNLISFKYTCGQDPCSCLNSE